MDVNLGLADSMSGYPSRSDLSRMKHRSLVDLGGYRTPGRRTTVATVLTVSLVCLLAVGTVLGAMAWRLVTGREAAGAGDGRTENTGEPRGNQTTWDTPTGKRFILFEYRSGTVNSKSFVGKVLLRIKWKFELNYTL